MERDAQQVTAEAVQMPIGDPKIVLIEDRIRWREHRFSFEPFQFSGDADRWFGILESPFLDRLPYNFFRSDKDESERLYVYTFTPAPPPLFDRGIALIEWGGDRFAVVLPAPWGSISKPGTSSAAPVEIMVRWDPLEQRVRIGVGVLDSRFGTITGFMKASTLPKAQIVVREKFDELLVDWRLHPLATVAAGYVLLATLTDDDGDSVLRTHNYIKNARSRFERMPDAAILDGAFHLRYPVSYEAALRVTREGMRIG